MKNKLVPILAGLLLCFSFGAAKNAFAGNDSRSMSASRIKFQPFTRFAFPVPANFDTTNGFCLSQSNFGFNSSKNLGGFDVTMKNNRFNNNARDFNFNRFFENRFTNVANAFDFANCSEFDFAGTFDNCKPNGIRK